MIRAIRLAVLVVVLQLAPVACGSDSERSNTLAGSVTAEESGTVRHVQVELDDGRIIDCVVFSHWNVDGGGISCDWEGGT